MRRLFIYALDVTTVAKETMHTGAPNVARNTVSDDDAGL